MNEKLTKILDDLRKIESEIDEFGREQEDFSDMFVVAICSQAINKVRRELQGNFEEGETNERKTNKDT